MKQSDIDWSKHQWQLLAVGGVWGIPSGGMIMVKNATGFELHDIMPYTDEMAAGAAMGMDVPQSAEVLKEFQRSQFELMRRHFEAAGLTFTDPKGLLK